MKKIMFILITMIILLVIMGSALKPGANKENLAMASEGNNITEENNNQQVVKQSKEKTVLELQNMLPEQYVEIKLCEIKWTENERNTGKDLYCTQGSGAWGPMSFALDTFNNIYIIDYGVKKYSEKGEFINFYNDDNYELSNMDNIEVSEDGKYIYGMNNGRMERYIYKYNMEEHRGERVEEGLNYQYKIIPHGVEVYQNGTLVKRYGGSKELIKKKEPNNIMYKLEEKDFRSKTLYNKLETPKQYNEEYGIYKTFVYYYIGKDRDNNYYLATYYPKKDQDWRKEQRSKMVVYKYKETGEILSVIILEEEGIRYLNYYLRKNLRVNKDGEVYYLCPKKDGAVIYKYERVK